MIFRVLCLLVSSLPVFCPPICSDEIHDAARDGDLQTVKRLLAADPELVNARDTRQMTALHHASRGIHPVVVIILVAHGADVTLEDVNGVTALHSLAYRGAAELVALMIARGAEVDARFVGERAAIHLAVATGDATVVEVLLANGGEVNLVDAMGNSPLLIASADGSADMATLLIEGGAAIDQANSRGDTPLTVAHREGHTEIVELLMANGADASLVEELPTVDGPYLGQEPPGDTPLIFAPRVVSTERDQLNAVFSPNGREFYFTQVTPGDSVIMAMGLGDDGWSRPRQASFSGGFRDVDHFMTRDGRKMFFCSLRPVPPETESRQNADIWVTERTESGWGEPVHLGNVVNSDEDDYYPTLADDGTLVFSSRRQGGHGTSDIYVSPSVDGVFLDPVNLGPAVNTEHTEFDPFIAPDKSFIIFASDRPGSLGMADLYISFAGNDGSWSKAVNMGPVINSNGRDFTPMLSPDGTYLFFTSSRAGAGDLWWVDASIIERLRPE